MTRCRIMDQYSPVSDDKIMITLGNHDVRGTSSADWNKDETVISEVLADGKTALYLERNSAYMPDTDGKVYFDRWLGGYHFIAINTENGIKDACIYQTISWNGWKKRWRRTPV